jgi:hypothetical protein
MHRLRVLTARPSAALAAALFFALPLPVLAAEPAACPDLSGTWLYPGREALAAACIFDEWDGRYQFWPAEGTFYRSAIAPHAIRITQDRCDRLTLAVRLEGVLDDQGQRGPDVEHEVVLDLRPDRNRTIAWGERSVLRRQIYTPEGTRFPPWRREAMTLELSIGEEGHLDYALRQETKGGKRLGGVRCRFGRP